MFSDGVVERRGRPLTDGLDDAGGGGRGARPAATRATCARWPPRRWPAQTDDDVAVLAVERAVALSRSATMLVAAEPTGPSRVRQWMTARLREWAVPEPVIGSAILCTSELTTNALLHAGTPAQVHIDLNAERLLVSVADTGTRGSVIRARTDAHEQPGPRAGPDRGAQRLLGHRPDGARLDGLVRDAPAGPPAGMTGRTFNDHVTTQLRSTTMRDGNTL